MGRLLRCDVRLLSLERVWVVGVLAGVRVICGVGRLSWVGWVNWVGWFWVVLRLTGRVEIMKSNSPFIPLARNEGGWWCVLGGVLLFRVLSGVVPWALGFLASGFGMGPGVSSPL